MTALAGFGLRSSDTMLVSRSQPLTALRLYFGLDGHPLEIHVSERGCGQGGNDIATGNWPPHAIEFIRPNHYDSISAVQCDTLRASLLGLAHHFAQARLRILKPPAVDNSHVP